MTKFVGMNASFKIKIEDKYFRMAKTVGVHVIQSKILSWIQLKHFTRNIKYMRS